MELSSTSVIPTGRADRFAKQFISHWGRHGEVTTTDEGTLMRFPASDHGAATEVHVVARPDALVIVNRADDASTLQKSCDSIAEHLHRFAGNRESLSISWS
ncbi:MAG TPA: DUF2218 domain-containing protein [Candidatus Dietzia intestinigallinarum]|nr:DUF2218 domain-containing protein [Candidatus Dietzia intestinigallinarum]